MPGADDVALEAAARVRVTVIVGAGDTGKTTLAARLASALAADGARVAVVDADVGQSEIGPPTTVGLGAVTRPVARLRDAEIIAMEFIGDTSPVRRIGPTADATGRLVRRALATGFAHVIVDTGGLVEGALGLALKRAKLRAVDPDLVIVVQRRDESEPLVRAALADGERPAIVRVAASAAATRRTQTQRRSHRDRMLEQYLRGAPSIRVSPDRVDDVRGPRGAPPIAVVEGLLVGVHSEDGETLGIGRVQAVEADGYIVVETPVAPARIARVVPGRVAWPAST